MLVSNPISKVIPVLSNMNLKNVILFKIHWYIYNKAFIGLRSCDKEQTERSIFEYANWPRLPAGLFSRPAMWHCCKVSN